MVNLAGIVAFVDSDSQPAAAAQGGGAGLGPGRPWWDVRTVHGNRCLVEMGKCGNSVRPVVGMAPLSHLTRANGPMPAPTRSPTPWGTHQGRDQGTLGGPIRGWLGDRSGGSVRRLELPAEGRSRPLELRK